MQLPGCETVFRNEKYFVHCLLCEMLFPRNHSDLIKSTHMTSKVQKYFGPIREMCRYKDAIQVQ